MFTNLFSRALPRVIKKRHSQGGSTQTPAQPHYRNTHKQKKRQNTKRHKRERPEEVEMRKCCEKHDFPLPASKSLSYFLTPGAIHYSPRENNLFPCLKLQTKTMGELCPHPRKHAVCACPYFVSMSEAQQNQQIRN